MMEMEMVNTKWQRQRENRREWQELLKREHEAEIWGQRGCGPIFDEPLMQSYNEWLNTWWGQPLLNLWDEKLVKQVYCFYLALAMIEIAKKGGPKIRKRSKPPGAVNQTLIRAGYLGEKPPGWMVGPSESEEALRELGYGVEKPPVDPRAGNAGPKSPGGPVPTPRVVPSPADL
jgi:hypothetical protein